MWQSPGFDEVLLQNCGCIDDIYNALRSSDLSEVVVTALKVLKVTETIPEPVQEEKCEIKSTQYRSDGNKAYKARIYQTALKLYNKALKYAPKDSLAMKLAYSNRSALLITVKAFEACIHDINTCLAMNCPADITDKLKKRKKEALYYRCMEEKEQTCFSNFVEDFFDFFGATNPQIPSASLNVGVTVESDIPKIIALNDIKVGTVIAVEYAYANILDADNKDIACYNCNQFSLNLVPCGGCCIALFCECCLKYDEYNVHNVECKIIYLLQMLECTEKLQLALRSFITMKDTTTWDTLIAISKTYGLKKIKKSSINEIYDDDLIGPLCFEDKRHFIYGAMYNHSFTIAAIIHFLENIPDFFPKNMIQKQEAIRCAGRILMFLAVYATPTIKANAASIINTNQISLHDNNDLGLFLFEGKLRNSCMPNTLVVGLNEKVALVALQPIKRKTELTISYLGHWLDKAQTVPATRKRNMVVLFGKICNCIICSGNFKNKKQFLSETQKRYYNKLKIEELTGNITMVNLASVYAKVCKTLSILSDVPFSVEYANVYKLFRACLTNLQNATVSNVLLERIGLNT